MPEYGDGNYRVILTYIKADQYIPVHRPECDLIFLVHKGTGTAIAGSETREIGPGDILIVKKGTARGIRARTDMEALHLVTPPPGEKDHEDVMKKIEQRQFQ